MMVHIELEKYIFDEKVNNKQKCNTQPSLLLNLSLLIIN